MAKRSDITTGVQTVTATGAVTGTLSTASMTGAYTIKIRVAEFSAASGTPSAIIAIQDTASATPFSDAVTVATVHVRDTVSKTADKTWNFRSYEIPNTRFGSTNTALRANVLSIGGSSPSLKVEAWLEQ